MNKIELFEAVGEIDSSLIKRCENEIVHVPMWTWVRWMSMAACLCLAILCSIMLPMLKQTPNITISSENSVDDPYNSQHQASTNDDTANPPVVANPSVYINKLEKEPSFMEAMICLNEKDYVPMTDNEFLNYYEVTFSIEKDVPTLKLQPQNPEYINGIYKNDKRGIYYDSHNFVFAADNNTQRIEFALDKTAHYPGLIVEAYECEHALIQSEINGVAVTIFQYTGWDRDNCYHTEFFNNGIAYCITSYNLSQEDYVAALASVIADNVVTDEIPTSAEDFHTISGMVNVVDKTENLIIVKLDDEAYSSLAVYLPDGEAKGYSYGDVVEVKYTGEPITIRTIWKQQLDSVTVIED